MEIDWNVVVRLFASLRKGHRTSNTEATKCPRTIVPYHEHNLSTEWKEIQLLIISFFVFMKWYHRLVGAPYTRRQFESRTQCDDLVVSSLTSFPSSRSELTTENLRPPFVEFAHPHFHSPKTCLVIGCSRINLSQQGLGPAHHDPNDKWYRKQAYRPSLISLFSRLKQRALKVNEIGDC